ncbi:MAG: DUF3467 domain-containing protein [Zavarzinella sp.]
MSDEASAGGAMVPVPPSVKPQHIRMEFNPANVTTTYCNLFRVGGTFEELIIDFGFHSGLILGGQVESAKFSQRILMSYPSAKRLLSSLTAAIRQHEASFGTIETEPGKRTKQS